jgi:hypothetical protein
VRSCPSGLPHAPMRELTLLSDPEYAAYFKDLSHDELDAFAKSFHFDNCKQREGLNEVLRSYA